MLEPIRTKQPFVLFCFTIHQSTTEHLIPNILIKVRVGGLVFTRARMLEVSIVNRRPVLMGVTPSHGEELYKVNVSDKKYIEKERKYIRKGC